MKRFYRLFILIIFLLYKYCNLVAQTFPNNFASSQLATGLDPTSFEFAPDGRIFLTEKNGSIRVIKNDILSPAPFLRVEVDNYNEKGLQNIILDPNFTSNQFVYLYYSPPGKPNRLVRVTAHGDEAIVGNEVLLLELDQLPAGIHNGGGMAFKDGKLLLGVGDNARGTNSQSLNTLMGKVLRINTDGTIPDDNPFYNSLTGNLRSIYALGVRNPFKISLQNGTGKVFLNDVGGNDWEEINDVLPGKNYGWPITEGRLTSTQTPPANYQDPIHSYNRNVGCAITGGAFYNPTTNQFPDSYIGQYFFADYCKGTISVLNPANKQITGFGTNINRAIDIKIAEDGSLYFLARGGLGGGSQQDNTSSNGGILWRVKYTGNGSPTIAIQPTDQTASIGFAATFIITASGNPTPSYQWQKNGIDIPGATYSSYTFDNVTLSDSGSRIKVIVSNSLGSMVSKEAILRIVKNQRPIAKIDKTNSSKLYAGGDTIKFSGIGTDAEDGALAASSLSWEIALYHFDIPMHFHPVLAPTSGIASGNYVIPTSGETSPNILFRIFLTVSDAGGLKHTDSLDVTLSKSLLSLNTLPSGIQLKVDGKNENTPYSFIGVSGLKRSLEAPISQIIGGDTYTFVGWSDGGQATRQIDFPSTNKTLTAIYYKAIDENPYPAAGLKYAYFEEKFNSVLNIKDATAVKTGVVSTFDLGPKNRKDIFGFHYEGFLTVPSDGIYTFYLKSDDGCNFYLGNNKLIDNDGMHNSSVEKFASIGLKAGSHKISSDYFEAFGEEVLDIKLDGPEIIKQSIPSRVLFHNVMPDDPITSLDFLNISGVSSNMNIFPQPANKTISLLFNAAKSEIGRLEIVSVNSVIEHQTLSSILEGKNVVSVDVSAIPEGMYFLILYLDNEIIKEKIMIQR